VPHEERQRQPLRADRDEERGERSEHGRGGVGDEERDGSAAAARHPAGEGDGVHAVGEVVGDDRERHHRDVRARSIAVVAMHVVDEDVALGEVEQDEAREDDVVARVRRACS
jgi:hypothetical protein